MTSPSWNASSLASAGAGIDFDRFFSREILMPLTSSAHHPPALRTHTLRALDRLRSFADQLAALLSPEDPAAFHDRHARLQCLLGDHVYPAIRDLSAFLVTLDPPAHTPVPLQAGSVLSGALQTLADVRTDLEQALAAVEDGSGIDPAPIQHVLTDLLLPALSGLEPAGQQTWIRMDPARIQELAARDLLGPRTLLPLTDPPEVTPALAPEEVDFQVFDLYGRWFAAWRNPASATDDYELVLIEEDPRRPGSLSYTDC